MGGLSGSFQFLNILLQSGQQIAVVVKRGAASSFRATMGTAREALFYKHFGKSFSDTIIFKSYFAEADMETGAMLLLLECANNAVPGNRNPRTTPTHSPDVTTLSRKCPPLTEQLERSLVRADKPNA